MLGQFPQSLKEDRRWVCFDAQKHPIDPATGQNAKPNDPATLGTLEAAQAAASRYGLRGVGVLLGQGLCGIDIDHCRDPSTGSLSEMAAQIIDQMQTYTEASPSGTGVHLLFWGKKPDGPCRKSSIGLEMYDGGRYFTVTGNALNRCPIEERTAACAAIHAQYLAKPEPPRVPAPAAVWKTVDRPDEELIQTACAAKDGERFAALYAGDWQAYYNSHSEADLSFANLLAFWFGADLQRMDRVFRSSGLMRPKWDQRRGAKTYGRATLERAVQDCQEVYCPAPQPDRAAFADQDEALQALNAKYNAPPDTAPAPGAKTYSLDDTGNARRFRDQYADRVRYNPTDKCWLVWDGIRWQRDDLASIKRLADEMLDQMERACFGMRALWGTELVGIVRTSASGNIVQLFGRKVYVLGADNKKHIARIQGAAFEYAYGDEITTWDEGVFQMLKSRLSCPHSHFDGTCNPESPQHWFKKFLDSDADIYCQAYTIDDNPTLPPAFVASLKQEYAGTVYYNRFILGQWCAANGIIYQPFADSIVAGDGRFLWPAKQTCTPWRIHIGVDFGGNGSRHAFVATGILPLYAGVVGLASQRVDPRGQDADYLAAQLIAFCTAVFARYGEIHYIFCDSAEQTLINHIRARLRACPLFWLADRVNNSAKITIIDRIRLTSILMGGGRFWYMPEAVSLRDALAAALWSQKHPGTDERLDDGTTDIGTLDAFEYTIERDYKRFTSR